MYQSFYREVLEDDPGLLRSHERAALLRSIQLLEKAEKAGVQSREAVEALLFMQRLWQFFLEQLASPENQLPPKLRADLISVGIGLLRQAEAIRLGQSRDFASLREISQTIANGLL